MPEEAFIYEAIRTPRGKQKNGALNEVKPLNLVVGLIEELRKRNPDLDENLISDLILGCVSPVGDQGGDIARAAVLASGMPVTAGGVQLNRFCASGLEAVNIAAQKVALRLGRPGAGRRRGVDEPRADGLRRRRDGHGPGDQLRRHVRPAGHRRRPDRHHRGLLPRRRRQLRAAQPGARPPRRGRVATSPSPWCRSATRTVC